MPRRWTTKKQNFESPLTHVLSNSTQADTITAVNQRDFLSLFTNKFDIPIQEENNEEKIKFENINTKPMNHYSPIKTPIKKKDIKYVANEMGTTAVICLIKQNYLFISNVGDSLAVMYKNGIAEKLSREHKVSLHCEKLRIEKSGARIINSRIEGRLNLTRAIGNKIYSYLY